MTDLLRCPLCGEALTREGSALLCPACHSYDIARQGYVNLLPVNQKRSLHPGDTRDMVAARRAFLEKGHYRPIAEKLAALLLPCLPDAPSVLDAGCGEGYYLSSLMECLPEGDFMGVDISKDAVRYAAGRNKRASWIVASAARLPLRDGCLDGVMSMFALTVPEEFRRVLKTGGIFLEITAGRGHLLGLKQLIYSELIEKEAKHAADYPGFHLITEETLEFPISLHSSEEIGQLLTMTPHFWRISKDGAERAAAAQALDDTAQVEFRLYQAE